MFHNFLIRKVIICDEKSSIRFQKLISFTKPSVFNVIIENLYKNFGYQLEFHFKSFESLKFITTIQTSKTVVAIKSYSLGR